MTEYTPRQQQALQDTPGICRAVDETHTFMCELDADHRGPHEGFEMPTITIDEAF